MKLENHDLVGDLITLPIDLFGSMPWTTTYERRLNEINTSAALRDFVTDWAAIWRIPCHKDWKPSQYEQQLTSGQYDATEALRCVFALRDGRSCVHCLEVDGDCPGANIFAPMLALKCLELSRDAKIAVNQALLGIVYEIIEKYTN